MNAKRMSISLSSEQERAILALRRTEEYCSFSYAEIIRRLLSEGLEQVSMGHTTPPTFPPSSGPEGGPTPAACPAP